MKTSRWARIWGGLLAVALVGAALVVGCGDSDSPSDGDTLGTDDTDTGDGEGTETGADTDADTDEDTGTPTESETGPSTETEEPSETEATESESEEEDTEAGIVHCGDNLALTCDLSVEICCQGLSSAECKAPAACTGLNAPVYCDGPEDCTADPAKDICCARFAMTGASTTCSAQCAGTANAAILCHDDEDCELPRTCKPCVAPGSPPQKMCVETCPY